MPKKIVLNSNNYYYTYLDDVFNGLGDIVREYNWLIADYECNYYPCDILQQNRYNYLWLSSNELFDLIIGKDVQFIWGVFLAFEKHIKKEDILKYPLPSSHNNVIVFQNPLSELEILSLDSRELYILSKKDYYINDFLLKFPETEEYIDD